MLPSLPMRTSPHLVALTLALARCSAERPMAPPVAAPVSTAPILRPGPTTIGTASLLPDGTLQIQSPHGNILLAASDPEYAPYLARMGGLRPGEQKTAPAFPDDFDAARVEAATRAYLVKSGVDVSICHGDVLGTDKEKNVTVSVDCGSDRYLLRLTHGSYGVTTLPVPRKQKLD